jgi:hypothetical protein
MSLMQVVMSFALSSLFGLLLLFLMVSALLLSVLLLLARLCQFLL